MTCSFAYNLYNSNYCQLGNLKPYKEPDKNEKFECPIRKKNSIGNNLTNRIYERKQINNQEKKKKLSERTTTQERQILVREKKIEMNFSCLDYFVYQIIYWK